MSTEPHKPDDNAIKTKSERCWLVIRFFVAAVLLIAAGLKAHQLITVPSLGVGLLHTRWFNILVVKFELFFGIWLIFGLLPKLTWLVSVGLFSTFLVVSIYKASILRTTSCGCFGAVEVNPWLTTVMDLTIVLFLITCRSSGDFFDWRKLLFQKTYNLKISGRLAIFIATWLCVAVPLTFLMVSAKFVVLSGDSKLSEFEKSITLEPNSWLGKKFPLLEYIEINDEFDLNDLKSGEWTILLYHNDCLICQEILAKLKNQQVNESLEKLVILEIPDGKTYRENKITELNRVKTGSLKRDRNWFVQTPIWIVVNYGNVINVSTDQNLKIKDLKNWR
ncbi:MAG: DoxX family protein [Planctomycetaceae bacterium]|jgi:hypothetical protein|nr:DoxX family protein [Planctomycetaceae bacterium]